MKTVSVSIANYCVPCECRCRYCLLASCGKTNGVDRKEAMDFADRALRVLSAAYRVWDALPESLEAEDLEGDMVFIGLVGMIDPCRPEVYSAVQECRGAGIRPVWSICRNWWPA